MGVDIRESRHRRQNGKSAETSAIIRMKSPRGRNALANRANKQNGGMARSLKTSLKIYHNSQKPQLMVCQFEKRLRMVGLRRAGCWRITVNALLAYYW